LAQVSVALPFNADVISFDSNREDGRFGDGQSIPAELLPDTVVSEDINFVIGNKTDGEKNAVSCEAQTIELPAGNYSKIYLLAAGTEDVKAGFIVDGQTTTLNIQKWTGYVGQFYNRILSRDENSVIEMEKPFSKGDNIAWYASHCHNDYPMKNEAYQYCYLYKYEIAIPSGAKTITLPKNRRVKILGMTLAAPGIPGLKPLDPLYDNFKGNKEFKLRAEK